MAKPSRITVEIDAPDLVDAVIKQLVETGTLVEVVRCRDCNHHEDQSPGMVYCPGLVGGWVSEDFFCADGERRDDGRPD